MNHSTEVTRRGKQSRDLVLDASNRQYLLFFLTDFSITCFIPIGKKNICVIEYRHSSGVYLGSQCPLWLFSSLPKH